MSYLVFARKWRPQTFDDIIGQEHITQTLKNAIAFDRIAHAYLFAGPRGIGKTSTARIFAKALSCEKGPAQTPCNKCASCKEITRAASLDVLEIDGASNTSVEQIRDLRENVKLSPAMGRYKIYIIDEVHMLSTSAFNALLKTLEEPPAHVKFIFATTQAHKVLPTIISRCQRFDFRRIPAEQIISKLKKIAKEEKVQIEPAALFSIAGASEGSMRDAESILDQIISYKKDNITAGDITSLLGMVDAEVYFDFTSKIINKDAGGVLELINDIASQGKDLFQFILGLLGHFRNLIILKVSAELSGLISQPEDNIEKLKKLSEKFSQQELLYSFSILVNLEQTARMSSDTRVPLEVASVKLTQVSQLTTLPQILEELKKINLPPEAAPRTLEHFEEKTKEQTIAEDVLPQEPVFTESSFTARTQASRAQDIKTQWQEFIEKVKSESLLTGLYLSEGRVSKIESNNLVIAFNGDGNFHLDYLEKKENKQLIEKELEKFFDENFKISFIKLNGEDTQPPKAKTVSQKDTAVKQDDSIINTALHMFGGRVIEE